jgi:hypothetical protein
LKANENPPKSTMQMPSQKGMEREAKRRKRRKEEEENIREIFYQMMFFNNTKHFFGLYT